jgi:hypothetical protein
VMLDDTENTASVARQLRALFELEGLDLEVKEWGELTDT